jgi:hypothetical protein
MSSKTNSSHMYAGQQHQYISSQDYFTEHYTAMLVQEAEKLYNRLIKEITKGITYDPGVAAVYRHHHHHCYRPHLMELQKSYDI